MLWQLPLSWQFGAMLQKKLSESIQFVKNVVANPTYGIRKGSLDSPRCKRRVQMTHYTDTDNTDGHTIYVLLGSLLASLISLPVVWYFAAQATWLLA